MGGKYGDGTKIPREVAKEKADRFYEMIKAILPEGQPERFEIAGSFRRGKDLIGDIEIVMLLSGRYHDVLKPIIGTAKNGKLSRTYVMDGSQMDLFIAEHEEHYAPSLLMATGSAEENIKTRTAARHMGYLLNQYGVWRKLEITDVEDGPKFYKRRKRKSDPWECFEWVAGMTEYEIYRALELTYREPNERVGFHK